MFNKQILEVLKRNNREDKFNSYGEHVKMMGGIRYGLHPTPEMDFQPDTLWTGDEMYEEEKPRMRGGRLIGGRQDAYSGGSLKSVGKSFKKIGKALAPVAKGIAKDVVMPVVKDFATKQGRKFLEQQLAKYAIPAAETAVMVAAGRRRKSCGGRISGGTLVGGGSDSSPEGRSANRRSARAMLVKKVMREHGCSLPEASKYIKENGIEY